MKNFYCDPKNEVGNWHCRICNATGECTTKHPCEFEVMDDTNRIHQFHLMTNGDLHEFYICTNCNLQITHDCANFMMREYEKLIKQHKKSDADYISIVLQLTMIKWLQPRRCLEDLKCDQRN